MSTSERLRNKQSELTNIQNTLAATTQKLSEVQTEEARELETLRTTHERNRDAFIESQRKEYESKADEYKKKSDTLKREIDGLNSQREQAEREVDRLSKDLAKETKSSY